jgi:hypothetical protein
VIFKDKNLQVANEKCNAVNEEIRQILISLQQLHLIRNHGKASLKNHSCKFYQFNSPPQHNSPPRLTGANQIPIAISIIYSAHCRPAFIFFQIIQRKCGSAEDKYFCPIEIL